MRKMMEKRAKKNLFFFEMVLGISILIGSMALTIFGGKSLAMIGAGGYALGLLLLGTASHFASREEEAKEKAVRIKRIQKVLEKRGRMKRALLRRERNPEIIEGATAKVIQKESKPNTIFLIKKQLIKEVSKEPTLVEENSKTLNLADNRVN